MKIEDVRFKAKIKDEKKLHNVEEIDFHMGILWVDEFGCDFENVEALLLYTGFKDKNSESIYEGDIFQFDNDDEKYLIDRQFMGLGYRKVNSGDCDFLPICELEKLLYEKKVTVIANCFENPELLKKEVE